MLIRVIVFYGATFLLTIILGGAQQAADLRGSEVILPQLAPGLAAGLMLLLFRGDHHRFSLIDRRIPGSRYLLAVAIPAAGGLAVYFAARLLAMPQVAGTSASTPWALLLWMPIGAIGEELGWRGYLHRRLNPGMAALASSIVVGILWAL